jgi:DNA-binding NarL/FixJ family response regulator
MPSSTPRIITVDPTWTIPRVVRSAIDLMDYPIIQIDVPSGTEALEEIKRGGCNLLVTALELDDDMTGVLLGAKVNQVHPGVNVIVLADVDDMEMDEETMADSPFVYLHRPVDVHQFLRVLTAGLNGGDIKGAFAAPVAAAPQVTDMGPVPNMDLKKAGTIIETLLRDLGAMTVILANRAGEVVLESGAPGYINRDRLTDALLPMVTANMEMGELVGGQYSVIQFYDGDEYDIYVLSIGLHHFLCIGFDGQNGARMLGNVNRYGRRSVEDLIALLGANAFIIEKAKPREVTQERPAPKVRKEKTGTQEVLPVIAQPKPVVQEEEFKLEPIANFNPDDIFGSGLNIDESQLDDLFNLDNLEQVVNQTSRSDVLSREDAERLGLIPKMDA